MSCAFCSFDKLFVGVKGMAGRLWDGEEDVKKYNNDKEVNEWREGRRGAGHIEVVSFFRFAVPLFTNRRRIAEGKLGAEKGSKQGNKGLKLTTVSPFY